MTVKITGVRPYYRRVMRDGGLRIYLRFPDGSCGQLTLDHVERETMPSGRSYTVEVYGAGDPRLVFTS